MAFNPSSSDEKRVEMDPKDLRFTQLDIAPSFTDPEHPKVKEAISLILGASWIQLCSVISLCTQTNKVLCGVKTTGVCMF
ncbi:hypothetical protein SUGI_0092180 [Cryptomeria japonica]|nr:hypothetical protein SUGI_0092180 [Cryptomeria japonica]